MKKLVAITGASSGFGRALAQLFSQAGHPLLLLARRTAPMQAMNLPHTLIKAVDVADYATFSAAVAEAEALYGPVDLMINNAGVMLLGPLATQTPEEWTRMLDVNVKGVLNGTQIVLADMMARNTGTIVNVSSIAGKKSFASHAAYCATKFGVHALTEVTREEVAHTNVRLMLIAPGAAETELLSHTSDEGIKTNYEAWKNDIGGAMAPEHVAEAIRFMYQMPQNVNIRELVIAATGQSA
ncbi:SDR family oxidoreductase [Neisseriaceae bacterium CLB008]|nr:SDR family oxidoreductase [Neisseriaceae bacterium]